MIYAVAADIALLIKQRPDARVCGYLSRAPENNNIVFHCSPVEKYCIFAP